MAFIKVKDKKGKEDAIINTDMICRILTPQGLHPTVLPDFGMAEIHN